MKELKALVFTLLEKEPNRISITTYAYSITYSSSDTDYEIYLNAYNNSYRLHIAVHDRITHYSNYLCEDLTEKEYMHIKWQIEYWDKYLLDKTVNKFKNFVNNTSENPMDKLLEDPTNE